MKMIDRNKIYSNSFLRLNHPLISEMIGSLGFDMLTFDMQHGSIDYQDVAKMISSIPPTVFPMARIPDNNPDIIMKLLDLGIYGIICPQINSVEESEKFVNACYYPPFGNRSYGPMRVGTKINNYVQVAKDYTFPFALVESKKGYENIDGICHTQGLKGIYVGPYDLSLSLGIQPVADFKNPELWNTITEIASKANEQNLLCGIQCYQLEWLEPLKKIGFKIFGVMDEFLIFKSSLDDRARNIHKAMDHII